MQPYQKVIAESMEAQAALKRIKIHSPDIDIGSLLKRMAIRKTVWNSGFVIKS